MENTQPVIASAPKSQEQRLRNLYNAAGFDASRMYPTLFSHLGYRKAVAEHIIRNTDPNLQADLEEIYQSVSEEIKRILGLD